MSWALGVNATIHLVVAAVFAVVGRRVLQRDVGDGSVALRAFASWWFLYAIQSTITAVRIALVAAGQTDPDLYQGLWQTENVLSVWALWGLGAYVQYLRSGRPRFWIAWAAALLLLSWFYVWVVSYHDVVAVAAGRWGTTFTFARPLGQTTQLLLVASYYGILVALAAWLAALARHAGDDRVTRRAWSVAAAIGVLAVAGLINLGIQDEIAIKGLLSLVRLPAALLVLSAYRPA